MARPLSDPAEFDYSLSIVVVGDVGTNKYRLKNCFINRDHRVRYRKTKRRTRLGANIDYTILTIGDKVIRAQVSDTGADESFWAVNSMYFRNASGIMLVYNIAEHQTFKKVESLLKNVRAEYNPDVVLMLVGNCLEFPSIFRSVSTKEGKDFAEKEGLLFVETSSDCVEQVSDLFMTLIKEILDKKISSEIPENIKSVNPIKQVAGQYIAIHKEKSLDEKQEEQGKEDVSQAWHHTRRRGIGIPQLREGEQFNRWSLVERGQNFDHEQFKIAQLEKTVQKLQQERKEELQQLHKNGQELSHQKQQLMHERDQLQIHNDKLQEQVTQLSAKVKTLQDQMAELSESKHSKTTSNDEFSWRVSHNEVTLTQHELGRGGWGVIWIGQLGEQKVAVKQMHEAIISQVNLDLLHREITTMAQLRNPNLLQFIGAVLDHPSGTPMIITEIMDMSLRKAYEDGLLTPTESCLSGCLGIMRDVALGLNYLHCLPDPIIHRDVSSANVLLESRGNNKWKTKISDFGSANKAKQAITRATGAAVYSAPESLQSIISVVTGRVKLTIKMDVFSYGVLLTEVLSCRFPDFSVFLEMLQEIESRSTRLNKLVRECIEESPTARPSMKDIIKQIDNIND